jgi:hypothetical protein
MLIGTMLALMLCISPVVAVSGSDFEVVIDDSGDIPTYKYCNPNYKKHPDCPNSPGEKYFLISCRGTDWLKSFVTFKPANIPDAPTMMVDTNSKVNIYLPYYTVDAWEIKYYSNFRKMSPPYDKYLKNAGTVNVKMVFGEYLPRGLELWISADQLLCTKHSYYNDKGMVEKPKWNIPEVKK